MRRRVAGLVLFLFVAQSSGALAATPLDARADVAVKLATLFDPLIGEIQASQVFAVLTGQANRYEATHSPMPEMHGNSARTGRPENPSISHDRVAASARQQGVQEVVNLPSHPPREHVLDPRAMRGYHAPTPKNANVGASISARSSTEILGQSTTIKPRRGIAPQPQTTVTNSAQAHRSLYGNAVQQENNVAPSDVGAGIVSWWDYQKRVVPGVGQALFNPGSGNLSIAATDVDIPERGMNLTFRRIFNSQSRHDVQGDDGSEQALFGNRWTNNLDMHIVYQGGSPAVISVYTESGFRCDYTSDGNGGWTPCAGIHATLEPDSQNKCDYWWIQPSGDSYYFHQDGNVNGCSTPAGNLGRLYEIVGRNSNNSITLNYSWVPNEPQTAQYIQQINVTHSDGDKLVLAFAVVAGSYNALSTVTRPDGGVIKYSYDNYGALIEVDKPGNNQSSNPVLQGKVPSGDLPETYATGSGQPLAEVCGPRATISWWSGSNYEGSCLTFDYDSVDRLTDWNVLGTLNFIPSDGTGTYLQPTQAYGWLPVYTANFVYGVGSSCTNTTSGTTTMCDTDGHSTIWSPDPAFRITTTKMATGDPGSGPTALVTVQTWDPSTPSTNNLIAVQDPQEFSNGTETDISYDQYGNITKVQLPSNGSLRPTYTYTYDQYHNVLSACDAVYNAANSGSCPTTHGSGALVFVYDTGNPDASEPYGKITDTYTPLGYHTSYIYNYNSSSEAGDYGLPTKIKGTTVTQIDNSTPTPQVNITYDGNGNITTYGYGLGNWTVAYDTLDRPKSSTDPDNVASRICYYPDGSTENTQSALQYKKDGYSLCGSNSVLFTYDSDGDVASERHNFNDSPGTTQKWYDGEGRLVEVQEATGSLSRYFYDITENGNNSPDLNISGWSQNFHGYGNLYKTQRYFIVPGNSGKSWNDVSGNAFDQLNRVIKLYQRTPGSGSPSQSPGPMEAKVYAYDANGQYGLLSSTTDPLNVTGTYGYDGDGWLTSKSYSDGTTPNSTYTDDPDGRVKKATSSVFGDENYTFDADGRLTTYAEGGGPSAMHPTVTYGYYPNGWRSSVTINAGTLFNSNSPEFTYDYQMDGLRKTLTVVGKANPFSWQYSAAGRMTSQSDPWTGQQIGNTTFNLQPWAPTYDITGSNPTGTASSIAFPNGAVYQGMTYDAEGEPTKFGVAPPSGFSTNQNPSTYVTGAELGYDAQGRFTSLAGTSPALSPSYQNVVTAAYQYGRTTGPAVDPYTGAAITSEAPAGSCSSGNLYSGIPYLTYDVAGRDQSTTTFGCSGSSYTSDQRSYDAENHTTSDVCNSDPSICPSSSFTNTYGWAATGQLRTYSTQSGGSTSNYRFHWDGDNVLFVTDASGNLVQLNVEKLGAAIYNPNTNSETGFVVYDRDFSGTYVDTHGKSGDSGQNVMPNYSKITNIKFGFTTTYLTGAFPGQGTAPLTPTFDIARTDGYQVGQLTLQGRRAYDPTIEQWTTPDDYRGRTADPSTQWPYAWNSGNPVTNDDPSGLDKLYVGFDNATPGHVLPFDHVYAVLIFDDGSKTVLSFGPSDGPQPYLNNAYHPADYLKLSMAPGALHQIKECKKQWCSWETALLTHYWAWINNRILYDPFPYNSNWALSMIFNESGIPTVLPPGQITPGWWTRSAGGPWVYWPNPDYGDQLFADDMMTIMNSIFGVNYIEWATGDAYTENEQ